MEQLSEILKAISNGVKNPTMALIGFIASIFSYIFYLAVSQKIRESNAQQHKEEAKQEDINKIEAQASQANNTARDRLNNRKVKTP